MFGFIHTLFGFNSKEKEDNNDIKADPNDDTDSLFNDSEFSDDGTEFTSDEDCPQKSSKINDNLHYIDVVGDNKLESDLWNDEWKAFEEAVTEENRQMFETDIKYLSLKGVVTNLVNDNEIIIDGEKPVKYDRCNITDLSVGDLVNIETNDDKEVTVKPLRYKILTAKITDYEKAYTRFIFSGHAFIRNTSFTTSLSVGDVIKCVVIETNCSNRYNWRAYPYTKVSDPSADNCDKVEDYTNELMEDKNGVKILRQIDFKEMKIKSNKTIIVWIKNTGKTPQILESVDNEEGENQISFHAFHKTYGKVTGPPYVIPANGEVFVELKCQAEYCGDHNELLIFKFEDFKIGRYVSVTVLDFSSDNQLARASRSDTTQFRRRRFGENTWIIPGEKLWPENKHIFDKLEKYSIPHKLWQTLENNWSLEDNFPEYKQLLDKTNYRKKFHTLLWLEELDNANKLNSYNMTGITIKRDGRFFAIVVPGLAEGRPSLIMGDKVFIYEETDPKNGEKRIVFEGFIHEIRKDEILVRFNEEFHREHVNGTVFCVMFQMGRMVFRRCHHAVDLAPHMVEQVLFPTNVIIKAPLKRVPIDSINWFNPTLNIKQKLAVVGALRGECRPTPYIIFGPPGTGKTVTIVESILQVFDKIPHSRIIACTAANSSADLIVQKLLDSGKISEKDLIRVTALHRVKSIPESVQCVTQVADEDYKKWLYHRVIVTTSSQAGVVYRHKIKSSHFTHVFIDEAAQVIEPESLIPISMSVIAHGVVVLAGDHQQLGPVVQSSKAKDGRLHRSLMERLMTRFDVYERNDSHKKYGYYNPKFVVKLVHNYRSDQQIMCLPSKMFYENELKFNAETDHKLLLSVKLNSAINFHGVNGEDRQDPDCPSWYNPQEIIQVCSYLDRLYEAGVKPEDIGIITPYRKQVMRIRTHIHDMGLVECRVATIEEFQGLEKRVIIVSMVRSMADHLDYDKKFNLGFIHNNKRFNVAISRAMSLLIIVGNPAILSRDKCWSQLIDFCLEHNCYNGVQFREFQPKRKVTFRERFENAKKNVDD